MKRLAAMSIAVCVLAAAARSEAADDASRPVVVGSKNFTESVILGEMAAHLLRDAGIDALTRPQLGGTRILWEALRRGEIDAYPEYTGTIVEEIFGGGDVSYDAIAERLAEQGIRMTSPLGFNNTYALGMKQSRAEALGIRTISDLRQHPDLQLGFSSEFTTRRDGWPGLQRRYGLPQRDVRGLDHRLAYQGVDTGAIDVIDLYSTDAEIAQYDLRVLEDDLGHFPPYEALFLYRDDLPHRVPGAVEAIQRLAGRIDDERMAAMNARTKVDRVSERRVAADYLAEHLGVQVEVYEVSAAERIWRHTKEHLRLVGTSLVAAILVAIPLGMVAHRRPALGQFILATTGVIQTIPSLALLVLLIVVLGQIGFWPAVVALFLYSLLPIVRNTTIGLQSIPNELRESALALGLPYFARLRLIELPLASPTILAGIKTTAVINIGFATLGAFVGAGGYGEPILTGLRHNDSSLILQGAIPSAVLALATQGAFELAERWLVPRGLRIPPIHD